MSETSNTTSTEKLAEAQALCARACAAHQQGELVSAQALYRQAISRNDRQVTAWRNLGALLRQHGKVDESRHCTEKALECDESDGSLWGNYGNVLRDQGNLEESCGAFRKGLEKAPTSLGLLQGLVISMGRMGEHQQVVELITSTIEESINVDGEQNKKNEIAELLLELGNAHYELGHIEEALKKWNEGIKVAGGEKRLFMGLNIAQVLCGQKKLNEAEQICKELMPLFPENENLIYAQGVIAKGQGNIDKAINLFETALELNPAYPICLNTYGLLLREIGRTHKARQCFEQALEHDNNFGAAMNNLGSVLKDVARYQEALMWLRRGSNALNDNPAAHSNVLFTLVGYELQPAKERIKEAERFAERFGNHPFERWRDRVIDPKPDKRLKIGLISPDFCRHAVSYFVEPLLEKWNREEVEIILYACGEQIDDYSKRLREKADQWVDFRKASDEECITRIQGDEIDILIDLAGHTAGNRLTVMAGKPAPIQATYLGYYGTTGLKQIDYWITDNTLHPTEEAFEDLSTEKKYRLNRCYVSYRPINEAPKVQSPPCTKNGRFTFGSFNQSRKITPQTAENWMKVLKSIPKSRLLLKSKNLGEEVEQERVRALFENLGLKKEDLELRGHSVSVKEHLEEYKDVDIALDTYPYTGCTTTADALWMGVPVLTVAGTSMVSRQAAAVLNGAGEAEWICENGNKMAEVAKILCSDTKKLSDNREKQRERVKKSALMNHLDLAQSLEKVFRVWWHKWLKEEGYQVENKNSKSEKVTEILTTRSTSITNSPILSIQLWLGPICKRNQNDWKEKGYKLVRLKSINPWGRAVKLFSENERKNAIAWIEEGVSSEQEKIWNNIYPQLKWDTKGPLARK